MTPVYILFRRHLNHNFSRSPGYLHETTLIFKKSSRIHQWLEAYTTPKPYPLNQLLVKICPEPAEWYYIDQTEFDIKYPPYKQGCWLTSEPVIDIQSLLIHRITLNENNQSLFTKP